MNLLSPYKKGRDSEKVLTLLASNFKLSPTISENDCK